MKRTYHRKNNHDNHDLCCYQKFKKHYKADLCPSIHGSHTPLLLTGMKQRVIRSRRWHTHNTEVTQVSDSLREGRHQGTSVSTTG